jgi:hypothetical protein
MRKYLFEGEISFGMHGAKNLANCTLIHLIVYSFNQHFIDSFTIHINYLKLI